MARTGGAGTQVLGAGGVRGGHLDSRARDGANPPWATIVSVGEGGGQGGDAAGCGGSQHPVVVLVVVGVGPAAAAAHPALTGPAPTHHTTPRPRPSSPFHVQGGVGWGGTERGRVGRSGWAPQKLLHSLPSKNSTALSTV